METNVAQKKKKKSLTKMLAHYYKPHIKLFILDLIAALFIAICDLFYPMITRQIINDFVPNNNLRLILTWAAALLGIYLIKCGLNYFVLSWGHIMGARMQADMRRDLFHHMQRLPFSYFDENQTGSLMSRIVNDLMEISELAHHGPEDLFISIVSLIGAFIMLSRINLNLTLIIFAFIPIIVVFNIMMRSKMKKAFRRRRETTAAINAEIENSLSGIRVSKAFTNEEYEEEKFDVRSSAYVDASADAYRVMGTFHSGMSLGVDLLTLISLIASGIFVYLGRINVGDFAAFILFTGMFTQPIRRLTGFVDQFQDGMSGFTRFSEIMQLPQEENPEAPITNKIINGEIEFKNVSFNYNENSAVLKDLSLHIPKHKTIALVGPSGGGKTTLCHLIPRFYIPTKGHVLLDGIDVQELDYTELRRCIGIVQQEVFIFTGSIRENIAYGNLDANESEIIDASKKAGLHDFVLTLPEGYNTYIGERGAKLSGGQKQRISIARVFLKNPPILILDEATSALDNLTELAIQQSFDTLSKNRTTLVVAHRLSTVRNADEIIVLSEDGIVEQGPHSHLMKIDNGVYKKLYETQFTGL